MQTKADLQNENARLKAEIEAIGKDNEKYRRQASEGNDRIKVLKEMIAALEIDLATVRGYAMRIVQEDNSKLETPDCGPIQDDFAAETYSRNRQMKTPAFEVPRTGGNATQIHLNMDEGLYGYSRAKTLKWFEV